MSRSPRNYHTLSQVPENLVAEEPVQTINEPSLDEYRGAQGTLGSIMMFMMRQSYIAALIIMMVSSEPNFILLL